MARQAHEAGPTEGRWAEIYSMLKAQPDLDTPQFWDSFHQAMKALLGGETEQVCLNRQSDQGPIRVQWTPVTEGQRERWPGKGPG